jgi:hypothetical protein
MSANAIFLIITHSPPSEITLGEFTRRIEAMQAFLGGFRFQVSRQRPPGYGGQAGVRFRVSGVRKNRQKI